jgi:hypothetical protein
VAGIFIRQGHAVEVVKNDYGEDLLIQTAHAGQMDATRLWVQVKGVADSARLRTGGGWLRVGFPIGHVLRWIRTADPVFVVTWDLTRDEGWFAQPGTQIDELRLNANKATIGLRFYPEHLLDEKAADRLIWDARVTHYATLCLRAAANERHHEQDGQEPGPAPSVVPLLAVDVLEMIGIVKARGGLYSLTDDAYASYTRYLARRFADTSGQADDLQSVDDVADALLQRCYEAATLSILRAAHGLTVYGFPIALLEHCCNVFLELAGTSKALSQAIEAVPAPPNFGGNRS